MKNLFSSMSLLLSLAVVALVLLAGQAPAGEPTGIVIGSATCPRSSTSVCILPPRGVRTIPVYSTNQTVLAGQVYSYNGRVYLAQTAGTITNSYPAGTVPGEGEVTADGITWMCVNYVTQPRVGFQIQTVSTNAGSMFFSIGGPQAEADRGLRLEYSNGVFIVSDSIQHPIFVYPTLTNTTIYAQDW